MPTRLEIVVEGQRQRAMPTNPDLTSGASPWKGFVLEQHNIPALEMPDHWVPYHLVTVGVSGPGKRIWFEGGREHVCAFGNGFVTLVSPREIRRLRWDKPARMIGVAIEPEAMRNMIPESLHGREVELRTQPGTDWPAIRQLVFRLQQELAAGCPTGPLAGESLCTQLAIEAITKYSIDRVELPHYKGGLSKPALRRVVDYIEACLERNLSVDDLAKIAGLSRYHFGKMFKESSGVSLHRYVLTHRIRRAQYLLKSCEAPLAEIAADVGFANQSHFTEAFTRVIGVTPGKYRAE